MKIAQKFHKFSHQTHLYVLPSKDCYDKKTLRKTHGCFSPSSILEECQIVGLHVVARYFVVCFRPLFSTVQKAEIIVCVGLNISQCLLYIIMLQKLDARTIKKGGLNWRLALIWARFLGVCKSL